VVNLHPVKVDNAESAAKSVLRILTLTHLEVSCNPSNQTASLGKAFVVDILEELETTSLQEP
jgi:hypothetical protein